MTAKHILVPTDFSEYADQALDYATQLAQQLQAYITLLHIIDTTPLGVVEGAAMLPPSYWQELETGLEQIMEESLKRLYDVGLQGETVIVHGVPFQTIIDTAKDKGSDLIIMGTHGRTGLPHALMGSVAEKVVRLAPCPVLVTRATTEASPP
jgi:nucleotide-binding universal stress UspA family protein